mmetsp:Transcript_30471/g.99012  ORF Transcript_30471/g.99012 Transcript_30471/m.99012 type:complete len:211 (-) Transcript_30471:745-1377(-)
MKLSTDSTTVSAVSPSRLDVASLPALRCPPFPALSARRQSSSSFAFRCRSMRCADSAFCCFSCSSFTCAALQFSRNPRTVGQNSRALSVSRTSPKYVSRRSKPARVASYAATASFSALRARSRKPSILSSKASMVMVKTTPLSTSTAVVTATTGSAARCHRSSSRSTWSRAFLACRTISSPVSSDTVSNLLPTAEKTGRSFVCAATALTK